ncbi:M56 family metallopeptidase [Lachnospiraceae bacterium 45-W7]
MSIMEMSASGAVMILAIAVIRALAINRLPKKTFLALWGVTLARLLIPYSLPSALSVYSLLGSLLSPAKTDLIRSSGPAVQISGVPLPNVGTVPPVSGVLCALPIVEPYILIWLAGVLACALFFAAAFWKCRREFRESMPVEDSFVRGWLEAHQLRRTIQLRYSDRISAPLTYGVFCPVLLLPKRTDWGDETALAYVLTHEYVHIRRFDALTKLALAVALCVHWFNPGVWIMYVLANRDMELSCDEAVVRLFGEHTKSAYAMTLIRMEEIRNGLRPLCNNFSKNAIQERIIAIMKTKRTTWLAVVAALVLVVCVTIAFATTGQAAQDSNEGDDANNAQTITNDYTVTSYVNPADGKTYYSWDGGKTWTAMTEKEFNDMSAQNGVEWWTKEEYAAWLEQEKINLQAIIGERGWNPTDGWYTWTQEMVDETIAQYEQTLKDIQGGMKISKSTTDGDTIVQFGFDPDSQASATDTQVIAGHAEALENISDHNVAVGYKQQLTPELLAEYKTYGLTYDEASKAFFFNEKLVRWFFDGYDMENGTATIYDYVNEDGVVDIRTVRQATQNADGSKNPGGKLAGIEEVSQEEFDSRFIITPQTAQEAVAFGDMSNAGGNTEESGDTGAGLMADFAKYAPYGITFVKSGSFGNIYWNGELVDVLVDHTPDGKFTTISSIKQGGIKIQTVYSVDGKLTGFEKIAD